MNQNAIDAEFYSTFKWGLIPERGILRVDSEGLQYIRILKSWAVIGVALAASVIYIGLLIWVIGQGGFLGLPSYLIFVFVVLLPAVYFVKQFIHQKALALEETFLHRKELEPIPVDFSHLLNISWPEISKMQINLKKPFVVSAKTSKGTFNFGVVVGGSELSRFSHVDSATAAQNLRSVVSNLAPNILNAD